jgi:hypothetical protein
MNRQTRGGVDSAFFLMNLCEKAGFGATNTDDWEISKPGDFLRARKKILCRRIWASQTGID